MDKEQIDSGEEIYYTTIHLKNMIKNHKKQFDEDLLKTTIEELCGVDN